MEESRPECQQDRGSHSRVQEGQEVEHTPFCVYEKAVERVDSIKFLGVHIFFVNV